MIRIHGQLGLGFLQVGLHGGDVVPHGAEDLIHLFSPWFSTGPEKRVSIGMCCFRLLDGPIFFGKIFCHLYTL